MSDTRFLFSEPQRGALTFVHTSALNYALVHGGQSAIVSCQLHNESDEAWHDIVLTISGEAINDEQIRIDSLSPHSSLDLTQRARITPAADEMIRLTEARQTSIGASVSIAGNEVLTKSFELRLMPYDQWLGLGERPEMVCAFVMPNHPLLSRLIASASQILKRMTGDGAMSGYQSGDANRVRQQIAAVYEAVRAEGITYVGVPASFEHDGQRIRTIDKVLTERLATCMDLSLLFASVLEALSINPVLVFVHGHAFVGAWQMPVVGDDASALLIGASEGISDFVFFEPTAATADEGVAFETAVDMAAERLRDDENFELYVDVYRSRLNGVRPMAMRAVDGNQWVVINDPSEHGSESAELRRVDRYDLSAYDSSDAQVTKYTIWERKLLDFSLRNNLLNMRQGRRILPLLSFSIDRLEDALQDGKSFTIQPFPLAEHPAAAQVVYDSKTLPQLEEMVTQQLAKGQIFSYLPEEELKDALKFMYRAARTSLEENGVSNLFMALGVLRWHESEQSTAPRYAPLLLLPIEIVRRAKGAGYTIRTRDEDISLNITLTEMLKQQHDVDLSCLNELPKDESGVDVRKIFAIIRDKIRAKRNWNVMDEALIGIFQFNKFVMWSDIHSNSEKMHSNPIIAGLVDGHLALPEDAPATDARQCDAEHRPADYIIPIDVDSSQFEAIVDSGAGHSFVLHGPPGTGKSQTITNMIANALYQGKRVLFVAEKMAALSVVQARLESIGLAPFCLELHSNKVTKQHFLRQMEAALEVQADDVGEYERLSEELYGKRRELIDYAEALHSRRYADLSLYDCIEGYLSIRGDMLDLDPEAMMRLSRHDLDSICSQLRRLDTVLRLVGRPSDNILEGLTITDGSAEAERNLRQAIHNAVDIIDKISKPEVINLCFDEIKLNGLRGPVDAYFELCNTKVQHIAHGNSIGYHELCREWDQTASMWFLKRYFKRRELLKKWEISIEDIENFRSTVRHAKSLRDTYNSLKGEIEASLGCDDMNVCRDRLNWCYELIRQLHAIRRVARIEVPNEQLYAALRRWNNPRANMRSWYNWCHEKQTLEEQGLACAVKYITENGKSGAQAANAFLKSYFYLIAQHIISNDDKLRHFNGSLFDHIIDDYRLLTRQFQELSKLVLIAKLAAGVPSQRMGAHESSELGKLKRNIANGGRGTSIRRIIDQIPTLLPRLSPCMLMSPLSVAQYIDLDAEKFDIVIFDEASQMPTSEAVGAIARGKALVVVGDPKQMPPTNFFTATAVGEDEAEIDDMESVLDDCLALSMPSRHLTWHYRSKHESLIAFSNAQYYEGRLLTFPSVDDLSHRVSLRTIEGVYQRSGARINLPEAQAVVREVMRRLRNPELSRLSIGIVSFNKNQQDKIEDLLSEELSRHPELERLAYESEEPIFVKNLENVQGDERDVILFSIGYGPDSSGKVSMNFGPLNNAGGERRLNVAVSRARHEMIVFSSIKSEQIDLRRTGSRGVEGLKKFLEYAEKGNAYMASESSATAPSEIARDIAKRLEARGYRVQTAVGRSRFKVDVAVVHPDDPSKYILGILLDGPEYYATKTARDREVVQPSVLKHLRWGVMRVWTLDWFEYADKVTDDIVERIEAERRHEHVEAAPKQTITVAATLGDENDATRSNDNAAEQTVSPCDTRADQNFNPATEYKVTQEETQAAPKGATLDSLERYRKRLKEQLQNIVAIEQPITDSLIYKRIVHLWGLSRVSPRLQQIVDNALTNSGLHSTRNYYSGRVWWTDRATAEAYTIFRASDRDIQDVPYIEMANAMRYVIDEQIALPADDLKRLTAKQLGYTRMGTNIVTAMTRTLDMLAGEGYVQLDSDKVSKK